MNTLNDLLLLLYDAIWAVKHQFGLRWVVWQTSAVDTYSLIIRPNKLGGSNLVVSHAWILRLLTSFDDGLGNGRATNSAATSISLLLLLPNSFFEIVHVVFVYQVINTLLRGDSHTICLKWWEIVRGSIISFWVIPKPTWRKISLLLLLGKRQVLSRIRVVDSCQPLDLNSLLRAQSHHMLLRNRILSTFQDFFRCLLSN
jgi:hypothetical protein